MQPNRRYAEGAGFIKFSTQEGKTKAYAFALREPAKKHQLVSRWLTRLPAACVWRRCNAKSKR